MAPPPQFSVGVPECQAASVRDAGGGGTARRDLSAARACAVRRLRPAGGLRSPRPRRPRLAPPFGNSGVRRGRCLASRRLPHRAAQHHLCPLPALCPSVRPSAGRGAPPSSPRAALASSSSPSPPTARGRALPPMVSRPEPESEAMDAELVVTPPGCSHLSSFKVDNWKQNLRAIYQCFVWSGTAEARKRKVRQPLPPAAPRAPRNCGVGRKRSLPLRCSLACSEEGGGAGGPCWGRKGEGRENLLAPCGSHSGCAPRGGHKSVLLSFSPPPPSLPFSCLPPFLSWGREGGDGAGAGSRECVQCWGWAIAGLGRVALECWYRGGRSPTFQLEATRSNSLGEGGLGGRCTENKKLT